MSEPTRHGWRRVQRGTMLHLVAITDRNVAVAPLVGAACGFHPGSEWNENAAPDNLRYCPACFDLKKKGA